MKGTMEMAGLTSFDAVIPNEIGGLNAFEAILAAHRFNKHVLDTDLVARAYPMVWQTVRCLNDVPIAPCSVADGSGRTEVSHPYQIPITDSNQTHRCFEQPKTTFMQKT
jgi:DUF917 family protein